MRAEWVMVIITSVYVVATICILIANCKSAKAAREQLEEMKRQFEAANRPDIEVEFHFIDRTWYAIRFVNQGNKTAQHVKINIDKSSIEGLPEKNFRKMLENIKEKECVIGVGQHYDLFIGGIKLRETPNIEPFAGSIEYKSQNNTYTKDIFVDLENYMTFYSTTNEEEKIVEQTKLIAKELSEIKKAILRMIREKTEQKTEVDTPTALPPQKENEL